MKWQDKYLFRPIDSGNYSLPLLCKCAKQYWTLLKHALLPHKPPGRVRSELPAIATQDDTVVDVCYRIYAETQDRVEKVERKAFNLLSYTSALFAVLVFIYTQVATTLYAKVPIVLAVLVLAASILISFRCLNIKGIQTCFLPAIYDFDSGNDKLNFDKNRVAKSYLSCSVYNHTIADNAVDVLRVARFVLVLGFALGLIGGLSGVLAHSDSDGQPQSEIDVLIQTQNELGKGLLRIGTILEEIHSQGLTVAGSHAIESLVVQIRTLTQKVVVQNSHRRVLTETLDSLDTVSHSQSQDSGRETREGP